MGVGVELLKLALMTISFENLDLGCDTKNKRQVVLIGKSLNNWFRRETGEGGEPC